LRIARRIRSGAGQSRIERSRSIGVALLVGTIVLLAGLASALDADETPKRAVHHASQVLGIEFDCPPTFTAGRYKSVPLPPSAVQAGMKPPFANAVVLVEPGQLRGHVLSAVPVGEVPTIAVDVQSGSDAEFKRANFLKPDYAVMIGGRTVYRLPGFPGPYGDQAFYYLIPFPDGRLAEITAHRFYFRDPKPAGSTEHPRTRYDRAIEDVIIPTLKTTSRP
jgi:hypothetical protein